MFCFRAEVQTVSSNIPVLVSIGLGERGMRNYRLVKETCQVLLKLVGQKPPTNSPVPALRSVMMTFSPLPVYITSQNIPFSNITVSGLDGKNSMPSRDRNFLFTFLLSGYWERIPWRVNNQNIKLTSHFHLSLEYMELHVSIYIAS
jgi:hypothetical protein